MMRHLLAFLTLLTGLAAVGVPGNASILEAIDCEIGVSVSAADVYTAEETNCPESGEEGVKREPGKSTTPGKPMRPIIRPPVLFGIDRAHE